jgi:tryptophan synthase alpha chain
MKTIIEQLALIKQRKKIGLMTHVVIGYPTLEDTFAVVQQMVSAGVDFIELQIPFSDPLADGPTIMKANDEALIGGVTLDNSFTFLSRVAHTFDIPFLLMGYYNTVFSHGVEEFCREAKKAGCQGVIIPDIPIDEEASEQFIANCQKYQLHHIRLLSPTSTNDRIQLNAKVENGFVYCTTRSGTTGVGGEIDSSLKEFLERVRKYITVPLAVGFGISRPEHVAALTNHAEVAVIGSAVIEQIQQNGVKSVYQFIQKLTSI